MPYGSPKFIQPWLREYWPNLTKGKKLYSIQEWQCYLIRRGRDIPAIDEHVCAELNIPHDYKSTKVNNLLSAIAVGEHDPIAVGNRGMIV
jgi:hypothetical protein